MSIKYVVADIDPANQALQFIDKRLTYDTYRGKESSQHNRYTIDQAHAILALLDEIRPDQAKLHIRTTDVSKRPENLPEERDYAEFCHQAKSKTGIGSQDAMKKNLFVDWNRLGLINRYDKHGVLIPPFSRNNVQYVSLSDVGIQFVRCDNIIQRNFLFSKLLNKFLSGFIENILNLLTTTSVNWITFNELMLFVSAIDHDDYGITPTECETLICQYRQLSRLRKDQTTNRLKEKLDPDTYKGNKTNKRDYHNWKNKYQQLWSLFKDLPFFVIEDDKNGNERLYLATSEVNAVEYHRKNMTRSPQAKADYFKKHKVVKTLGYELDHIIPLLVANNIEEFHCLDNWKNLLYMDAKTHAIKSQQGSHHMVLNKSPNNPNELILQDARDVNYTLESQLHLKNGYECLYNSELTETLVDYNSDFLTRSSAKV